jgi:hypothetical protein
MEDDKEFEIEVRSKHYILITGEYFGMSDPRYMLIRSELRGDTKSTLFLLGVDLVLVSTKYIGTSNEEVKTKLYQAATESIGSFLEENELIEGSTYYGEYLQDESFEIGTDKPSWENGSWGQKMT